jgi:hypothetical protein
MIYNVEKLVADYNHNMKVINSNLSFAMNYVEHVNFIDIEGLVSRF